MEINICFASDNNYVQHLATAIASILTNAKEDDELNIYVLDGGVSKESENNLMSLCSIKNFKLTLIKTDNENFVNLQQNSSYISSAGYYRFMIPTLLPKEIEKVLYLDCDMIIKESLANLFNTDITKYWMAGVEDIGYYSHRKILGRETESFYINSGLLLINLKKWREDGVEQKLFKFAQETTEKLVHNDQDVINMVLNSKSKPLDFKYNAQDQCFYKNTWRTHPKGEAIKIAAINPAIIHYTGPEKPWKKVLTVNKADEYLKYLRLTPWKDKMPSDFTIMLSGLKGALKCILFKPQSILDSGFWKKNSLDKRKILLSESKY